MTQNKPSYTGVTTASPFLLTLLTTPGSVTLRIENSEPGSSRGARGEVAAAYNACQELRHVYPTTSTEPGAG